MPRGFTSPRYFIPQQANPPVAGGGYRQTDAGIPPGDSPSGNAGWVRAVGEGADSPSQGGHLRRRAGHEEIHREAEVTSLGAGVFGRTVHVEVEGAAKRQQESGKKEQEAARAKAQSLPRRRRHRRSARGAPRPEPRPPLPERTLTAARRRLRTPKLARHSLGGESRTPPEEAGGLSCRAAERPPGKWGAGRAGRGQQRRRPLASLQLGRPAPRFALGTARVSASPPAGARRRAGGGGGEGGGAGPGGRAAARRRKWGRRVVLRPGRAERTSVRVVASRAESEVPAPKPWSLRVPSSAGAMERGPLTQLKGDRGGRRAGGASQPAHVQGHPALPGPAGNSVRLLLRAEESFIRLSVSAS